MPECDICKYEDGVVTPAVYDGKTKMGPWAFMCQPHWERSCTSIWTKLKEKP